VGHTGAVVDVLGYIEGTLVAFGAEGLAGAEYRVWVRARGAVGSVAGEGLHHEEFVITWLAEVDWGGVDGDVPPKWSSEDGRHGACNGRIGGMERTSTSDRSTIDGARHAGVYQDWLIWRSESKWRVAVSKDGTSPDLCGEEKHNR
jgi:hypothetical protein